MKRNRRLFSAYEMELLARNPYTYRVRARQLLFTAEFKRRFWEQYERGGDVQQIFESMGYDPLVVGYTRMHSVPQNLRKVVEAGRHLQMGIRGVVRNLRKAVGIRAVRNNKQRKCSMRSHIFASMWSF